MLIPDPTSANSTGYCHPDFDSFALVNDIRLPSSNVGNNWALKSKGLHHEASTPLIREPKYQFMESMIMSQW